MEEREEWVEGIKKASHQFLDKVKTHLADESIKTLIGEGDYAESILNTAKKIMQMLLLWARIVKNGLKI